MTNSEPATVAPGSSPHSSQPEHHSVGGSRQWWILAVACLAQLMVVLDATIVNIAMPTAQEDLGFSVDNRQWIVTAYALAFGSLLLVGGRLGDLIGRKIAFIVGLVGFAGASAIGGAATSFGMLVAGRVGQGVFGALLAPAALSLLTTTFTDPHQRAKAFSIFGAVAGAGGAVGLILGGALTEYLSWRWCLYVNVPLGIVALIGGLLLLPRASRAEGATLDIPGTVLSVAGLVSLVYGLANAETDGWSSGSTYGLVVAGAILLAIFAFVQTRVSDPLLPMSVLADRNRGGSFLALAVSGAGMFGLMLFLTYYMSTTLAFTPLKTGFAFMPMVVGLVGAAQLSTPLVERIGVKIPISAGFFISAVALALFGQLDLASTYGTGVAPGLFIAGVGLGLIMAPGIAAATDRVDPKNAGVAGAAVNTFQQIGGSIGTAVLSALAATAATDYLTDHDPSDPTVLAQAGMESYTTAFWVSALIFVAGGVISAIVLRHGAIVRDPDAAPVMAH